MNRSRRAPRHDSPPPRLALALWSGLSLVLLATAAGCAPDDVTCGEGTVQQGDQCVATSPDAAVASAELPVSVVLQPNTLRVVEGFAACPALTLAYADGTVHMVSLDPAYALPGFSTITELGLAVAWDSPDGTISTGLAPGCAFAAVGVRPGSTLVSVRITAAGGESRVVGTASAEVLALPADARVDGVSVLSTLVSNGLLSDAYWIAAAEEYVSGMDLLGVGQGATVWPRVAIDDPSVAGASRLPVRGQLEVTSSNTAVASYQDGTLTAHAAGRVMVRVGYRVGPRDLGAASTAVEISGGTRTLDLRLGVPVDDSGKVLPDAIRTATQLPEGQCATFPVYARTVHDAATGADQLFLRDVTSRASYDVVGAGLVQDGAAGRFCARARGDAAVRACFDDVCATWGVVVWDPASFPTLTITLPASLRLQPSSAVQIRCVPFQATATLPGLGAMDVSASPALHFREPVGAGGSGLQVVLDQRTGLAQRDGGALCLPLRWTQNTSEERWLGVGYGQAQASAAIVIQPPLQ